MSLDKDSVMPFEVKALGIRGRVVRLGSVVDDILSRHDYPTTVSALLAEAVALAALLGSALKFDGKFILQTKTDGPVSMLVADFQAPSGVRGVARFNASQVAALGASPTQRQLLGDGYLVMTIDQGAEMDRYQGIVALGQGNLSHAAHQYFLKSEQIPTRLKLAAGPLQLRGDRSAHWRAGAILVQHLPREGGLPTTQASPGESPARKGDDAMEDDDWIKAQLLLDTVEPHELLDPTLPAEDLLFRLYHEDGVTVYSKIAIMRHCTCSQATVADMLRQFSGADRADMVKDGFIEVVCEFCSTAYRFTPSQFA